MPVRTGQHRQDLSIINAVGADAVQRLHRIGQPALSNRVDQVEDRERARGRHHCFDDRLVDIRLAGVERKLVDGLGQDSAISAGTLDQGLCGVTSQVQIALPDLASQPAERFLRLQAGKLAHVGVRADQFQQLIVATQLVLDEYEHRRGRYQLQQFGQTVPLAELTPAAGLIAFESGAESVDPDPAHAAKEWRG